MRSEALCLSAISNPFFVFMGDMAWERASLITNALGLSSGEVYFDSFLSFEGDEAALSSNSVSLI